MTNERFIKSLNDTFDPKDIELDKISKHFYAKDWSSVKATEPCAVVFPRSTKQVADVVRLCNETSMPFIGSGGRTGLSGGATATNNELIISFDKMNNVIDYDSSDRTVLCEPGITTHELQNFALSNDLYYPVNFSSSGSSQIGGNIATNAGGIKVIKYGHTKNYVNGLEVISGDGKKYNYDKRLIKNATGPDLKDIFIGSEGIFGLFTKCRMRLINKPPETKLSIIGFSNLQKLNAIKSSILTSHDVEAIEFFTLTSRNKVKESYPKLKNINIESKYFIIVEYSSNLLEKVFEDLILSDSIDDLLISQNEKQKNDMWENRMLISESISRLKPLKFDIAVPVDSFALLVHEIESIIKKFKGVQPILFGHVGDGNLHANFISFDDKGIDIKISKELSNYIFKLIERLKGTISAEHGIGYIKKELLLKQTSKEEINLLKSIKNIYDPNKLLNPNKLINS